MNEKKQIDWMITIIPIMVVIVLSVIFFVFPTESNAILGQIRNFISNHFGVYFLMLGLGFFLLSMYLCFSKYGNIVLGGTEEKPKYSFFVWGSMMFTCGLAADILFYSFSEWMMYVENPHIAELGNYEEWVGVFSLYHWSFIPWAFYLVLAVAFGFMLHVRKRKKQKYSEACRKILGEKTDGRIGKIIDLLAIFALLAGTSTTFGVATPLMAEIVENICRISLDRTVITIIILCLTCALYTYSLLHGIHGISILARGCMYLFFSLILYVFLTGGKAQFIVDSGVQSMGKMIQHFVELSTYTDPVRTTRFAQEWTVYYWAYWMVWCVAAPFFIGSISKGRTIKQTILGGYVFGVGSTVISFVVFGNYSLGLQVMGEVDFISEFKKNGDIYEMIMKVIDTLPGGIIVLGVVLLTMIALYATSFDSIAYTVSCYCYQNLENELLPCRRFQLVWCIVLILFPIALVFSESTLSNLQSVSIIAAFPLGIVLIMIIVSFMKDAKQYLKENENREILTK